MGEMIERVALAISGSDDASNILEIHRHRARAAIKAMREPTPEMVNLAFNQSTIIGMWKEMIDEALR